MRPGSAQASQSGSHLIGTDGGLFEGSEAAADSSLVGSPTSTTVVVMSSLLMFGVSLESVERPHRMLPWSAWIGDEDADVDPVRPARARVARTAGPRAAAARPGGEPREPR